MMPEIKPGDPPPTGRYVIVYPDGTRREVYGQPPPPPSPRPTARQQARVAWGYAWRWLLVAGTVAVIRYVIPLLTTRHH